MEKSFYFIRHGEGLKTPGSDELTDYGRNEISAIANRLRLGKKDALYRTANNFKSKATAALLECPSTLDLVGDVARMEASGKIQSCSFLDYKDPSVHPDFHGHLREAYTKKRVLEFMVNSSDRLGGNRLDLSTYANVSNEFTENLLQDTKNNMLNHIVYIGREALISSFSARITEMLEGVLKQQQYVDWYEDTIECNERCDKLGGILVSKLGSGRKPYWRWSDTFGDIYFSQNDFNRFRK